MFRLVLFIAVMIGVFLLSFGAISNADFFSNHSPIINLILNAGIGVLGTIAIFTLIGSFFKNPPALPFAPSLIAERGHNVYSVGNESVRTVVGAAFRSAGYALQGTFTAGPTNQRLFGADLVLMLADFLPEKEASYDPTRLPSIARSLVAKDPENAAKCVVRQLKLLGFAAHIHTPLPGHKDKFFMVTSDAFIGGWGLAFRVWGPKMGKPDAWDFGS